MKRPLENNHVHLIIAALIAQAKAAPSDEAYKLARAGWAFVRSQDWGPQSDACLKFEKIGNDAAEALHYEDMHEAEPDFDVLRMRQAEQEAEDAYDRDVAMGLEPPRGWD